MIDSTKCTYSGTDPCVTWAECKKGKCLPVTFKPATKWSVKYDAPAYGTGFTKTGSDPAGKYTGDCYGKSQSVTVAKGSSGDYTVTSEPKCYTSSKDPARYCIYCAGANCAKGHTVTLKKVTGALWQGTCGKYIIKLRMGCK